VTTRSAERSEGNPRQATLDRVLEQRKTPNQRPGVVDLFCCVVFLQ